jgi:hypothetical protein
VKILLISIPYITCGGLEAGADERAPVRLFLVYTAYSDKSIKLLSHIQYPSIKRGERKKERKEKVFDSKEVYTVVRLQIITNR